MFGEGGAYALSGLGAYGWFCQAQRVRRGLDVLTHRRAEAMATGESYWRVVEVPADGTADGLVEGTESRCGVVVWKVGRVWYVCRQEPVEHRGHRGALVRFCLR